MNDIVIPKQIDIEVTSRCNLSCRFCPQLEAEDGGDMDFDLFISIVDRVHSEPHLKNVTLVLWLNGEPLLHPRYAEMVKYVTDRKIRCYITTNGMIWNEELFENITTPGSSCYQLIFSLDGLMDRKSHSIERARPGSDREKIDLNIRKLLAMKEKKNSTLDIATKICMRGQDWGEIEEYVSYWLREGMDFVCVGRALVDEQTPEMRVYPCQYSDNAFMVIKSDGRLVLCAYNVEATNDPGCAVGKMDLSTPLLDLYNNEKYRQFRQDQRGGIFNGPCRTCGFAYTGQGLNGYIEFRDKTLIHGLIYYQADYYNQFFSLVKKWKNPEYYGPGFHGPSNYD